MADDPYNDGYTHEALHVALMLGEVVEHYIVETRCSDQFPDVKEQAEKVCAALYDLYQLIGTKFSDG